MRALVSILTLAAVFGAAIPHASAQTQRSRPTPPWELSAPTLMPWEKQLKKYYERQNKVLTPPAYNPNARTDAISRRLNADPALAIGLPPNALPGGPDDALSGAPTFDPYAGQFDANGDGAISRSEYMQNNRVYVPSGPGGVSRAQRMNERLGSQFRALDADRDGRISAEEYNAVPNARF